MRTIKRTAAFVRSDSLQSTASTAGRGGEVNSTPSPAYKQSVSTDTQETLTYELPKDVDVS